MRAADLIRDYIRPYLSDSVAPFAYDDRFILNIINGGLRDMYAKCPIAFYIDSIVETSPEMLRTSSQTLPVSDYYIEAIAHYCAWQIMSMNTDDQIILQMSATHQQNYYGLIA